MFANDLPDEFDQLIIDRLIRNEEKSVGKIEAVIRGKINRFNGVRSIGLIIRFVLINIARILNITLNPISRRKIGQRLTALRWDNVRWKLEFDWDVRVKSSSPVRRDDPIVRSTVEICPGNVRWKFESLSVHSERRKKRLQNHVSNTMEIFVVEAKQKFE